MLADLEQGYLQRVAFVVPGEARWTLPLYELALMTARQAWSMGMDRVRFTLVTPEDRPLAMFGTPASEAVAALLDDHAIDFVGSSYPSVGRGYVIADPGGRRIDADRIVALPALGGRALDGVPADGDGFIPVDAHGRVPSLPGVYAAGDGTNFPIKQGGLATQQADAVAEAIAAEVGAPGARAVPARCCEDCCSPAATTASSATWSPVAAARVRRRRTRCGGRRRRSPAATSPAICSAATRL